jgi:hypothetical protein
VTLPLTREEQRLLEAIERHTMEGNGQLVIDLPGLAQDIGVDPVEGVPYLLDLIGKICRERGIGYTVMEGGGLKPS